MALTREFGTADNARDRSSTDKPRTSPHWRTLPRGRLGGCSGCDALGSVFGAVDTSTIIYPGACDDPNPVTSMINIGNTRSMLRDLGFNIPPNTGRNPDGSVAGPYCYDAFMTVAVPLFRQAVGLPVLEQLDNEFDQALGKAWDNWSNLRPWRINAAPAGGSGLGLGLLALAAVVFATKK